MKLETLIMTVVLTGIAHTAYAQTDILIFDNGDRLTGEIKGLERGRLSFETEATDTIQIEWENVAYLTSNQTLRIELGSGARYLGQLERTTAEAVLQVQTSAGRVSLDRETVVEIVPIETTFFDRLEIDIRGGYNFTKANGITQLNVGVDTVYRTEEREFQFGLNSNVSRSDETETAERESLDFLYLRRRPNRWLMGAIANLESNDELGVDRRASVGGGAGRTLRQTNRSRFIWLTGLQFTEERLADATQPENSVEGLGIVSFDWFRFDEPELDISTTLGVFPSLSDHGRVRANLGARVRWEIVEDLFWELGLDHSFDSDPLISGAEKSDYIVSTSIGWSF